MSFRRLVRPTFVGALASLSAIPFVKIGVACDPAIQYVPSDLREARFWKVDVSPKSQKPDQMIDLQGALSWKFPVEYLETYTPPDPQRLDQMIDQQETLSWETSAGTQELEAKSCENIKLFFVGLVIIAVFLIFLIMAGESAPMIMML